MPPLQTVAGVVCCALIVAYGDAAKGETIQHSLTSVSRLPYNACAWFVYLEYSQLKPFSGTECVIISATPALPVCTLSIANNLPAMSVSQIRRDQGKAFTVQALVKIKAEVALYNPQHLSFRR